MNQAQHSRLVRFLEGCLGRADFLVLGELASIKLVLPEVVFAITTGASGGLRFRAEDGGGSAVAGHEGTLRRLRIGLNRFAERNTWLFDAVSAGTVFLRDDDRLAERLSSSRNQYQHLFRDLERLKREIARAPAASAALFDAPAIQRVVFHIANAVSAKSQAAPPGRPQVRRAWALPRGCGLVFINLLQGTTHLDRELSVWISANLGSRAAVFDSSNWRQALRRADRNTIAFCFGVHDRHSRSDCLDALCAQLGRFRRVAFIDVGESCESLPPDRLPGTASNASWFLATDRTYFGALRARLPAERRIPYIPLVSRELLRFKMPLEPLFDHFICAHGGQDVETLLREPCGSYLSRRKLLIATKWGRWGGSAFAGPGPAETERVRYYSRLRERFPQAVFLPYVPQSLYFYLWRTARTIVVPSPMAHDHMSYTLAAAMLSGRGVVTTDHPALSAIDRDCFLFLRPSDERGARELDAVFDDDVRAAAAAQAAARFATERLEFSRIIENVVAGTLADAARGR